MGKIHPKQIDDAATILASQQAFEAEQERQAKARIIVPVGAETEAADDDGRDTHPVQEPPYDNY